MWQWLSLNALLWLYLSHSRHIIALHIPDLIRTWGVFNTINRLVCVFFCRQKLIIPGGSYPVILNTYFCQKVIAKGDSKTTHEVQYWDTPLPRRCITLAQMFVFKMVTNNSPESQVNPHWLRVFMLCNKIRLERIYVKVKMFPFGPPPYIQQMYILEHQVVIMLKKLLFSSAFTVSF